ncbi:HupE/UreJ family protein [Roseibium aggregatum]|uniref:Hydrogenase/urease accessory protein HupE n=1 Tax=Roseibium aggregatum TaxID=187304 RepID=A0A926S8N6_9HYPH|nr:HupE/UreJ family protein [Roseibium aggregatum]MBD1545229.1 hypothetical protein [Roseibium aggregatum]
MLHGRLQKSLHIFLLVLAGVLAVTGNAGAHFSDGTKLRTILLTIEDGALAAYIRTPAPLVFSDLVVRSQTQDEPLHSPYLSYETTATGGSYRLDLAGIEADSQAFSDRLAGSLAFSQSGADLKATVTGFRIRERMPDDEFNTGDSARSALAASGTEAEPQFGSAVIDFRIALQAPAPDAAVTVKAGYDPLIPGPGVSIENHLVDARISPPVSSTRPGQLEDGVEINGSHLATAIEFIHQGTLHILDGLDHVFLVVALALGVGATRKLIWLVTAFTLGHSVTLIASFLGLTPSWPWFIPLVEAAIAASVLYAAVAALLRRSGSILVFGAIGLLHGLGFSFVLGDILGRNAPDLILALASFNIGIEVGQIAILATTLGIVYAVTRLSEPAVRPLRVGALSGIAFLSAWWVVERMMVVV